MGYTTNFKGKFKLNKTLSLEDYRWLANFAEERHEDPKYPGIWCQWVPSEDGNYIQWDEGEKFYEYTEWLQWLIANFFQPKGYTLEGVVDWEGEEQGDVGKIIVKDNKVATQDMVLVTRCPHCKKEINPEDLEQIKETED